MRLSGVANTTISGLSEGMMWDFKDKKPAKFLLDYFGFPEDVVADIVPTFSIQSTVCKAAAEELGLKEGTPISYRGGDQPNNALSLNVFNPARLHLRRERAAWYMVCSARPTTTRRAV